MLSFNVLLCQVARFMLAECISWLGRNTTIPSHLKQEEARLKCIYIVYTAPLFGIKYTWPVTNNTVTVVACFNVIILKYTVSHSSLSVYLCPTQPQCFQLKFCLVITKPPTIQFCLSWPGTVQFGPRTIPNIVYSVVTSSFPINLKSYQINIVCLR